MITYNCGGSTTRQCLAQRAGHTSERSPGSRDQADAAERAPTNRGTPAAARIAATVPVGKGWRAPGKATISEYFYFELF